jgi:hypothetical protein
MSIELRERRCFSVFSGYIGDAVDAILELDRNEPVLMVFNDVLVEIGLDDTREMVRAKWDAKYLASIR